MKHLKNKLIAFLAAGVLAFQMPVTLYATEAPEPPVPEAPEETGDDPGGDVGESAAPTYSSGGSAYVTIGDTYVTQTVSAGQQVTLVVPIVNYAYFPITDIVVTPQVTNLASTWPFKPETTGYTKHVAYIAPYGEGVDVNAQRADVVFNFTVRPDAYTGYYPLNFNLTYIVNENIESTSITCYLNVKGAPGAGTLEEKTSEKNVSKPRMIVTGFETNPERIHAGETFTATVHVQNTSTSTAIRNALFDLQADVETTGSGTTATSYAAFLPTSGSSSIYKDKIAPGETVDLSIEMSARADLTEKPYVLDVKMTYDAGDNADLTDTASVSIPIYQEARFDTGEEAVGEPYATVGEENSLSFSIYNTGRTTLTNVWFRFHDEYVEGEDVFVGTIEPGNTGYVDASFIPMSANEGTLSGAIEYEDDAGNVTSVDKEFELYISEFSMDDLEYDPEMEYIEEEPTGLPVYVWILIIAGAAVAVIIIIVLAVRSRKKKQAALMEEDEDDEEDEDFPSLTEQEEEPESEPEPEKKDKKEKNRTSKNGQDEGKK
ncbi:MAG: hypothetical protein II754_02815 [Lachnospiraceae bacterium]|nr:hypothetical protein [Lachnospiraceae bacterium]